MNISRREVLLQSFASVAMAALPELDPASPARCRARDLGLSPGVFPPGPHNAITDVAGVRVGHLTLVEGDRVRTGVTAILPHGGNLFQDKVSGGVFVGNAYGKLAGSTQVHELGTIETPVILTNTLAVGTGMLGAISWTLSKPGNERVVSVNALVGETNDSGLNDIRGMHVTPQHVIAAIENANTGAVKEGSVGAGTGTMCLGWKGGIGTSSRTVPERFGGHTVGVLVQTNFGGVLTMDGAPVGKELGRFDYAPLRKGSCMIVVATDAPLSGRGCERLAARSVFALARVGSSYENGSGDFAIAFSTAPSARVKYEALGQSQYATVTTDSMSPLFEAALEATEEAVYNSLLQATTVKSNYGTAEAIPIDKVRAILKKYHAVS
ncbi:MAG: P1 family peptidase [Candidatus Eremiobacteraeota bacterium]|nr:P1 family peptidase [Candidatus Eremiobacteraeota bacterium]